MAPMNRPLALAAAIATTAALWATAPAAHATDPRADTRRCVDHRESNSTQKPYGRTELERRWEVKGLGKPVDVVGFGRVIAYPRCNRPFDPYDTSDPNGAWTGAIYDRHRHLVTVVWFCNTDA